MVVVVVCVCGVCVCVWGGGGGVSGLPLERVAGFTHCHPTIKRSLKLIFKRRKKNRQSTYNVVSTLCACWDGC